MRTIRLGDSGADVATWQRFLIGQGLDPGPADGAFGPRTRSATITFQGRSGLTPDGVVGPASWARAAALGPAAPEPEPAEGEPPDQQAPAMSLPARATGAMTGSQFLDWTKSASTQEREEAIFAEAAAGNVPSFARLFCRVALSCTGEDGAARTGIAWVTPEYLALGSDADFVRIPMSPITAQRIADLAGCALPTRRLVDRIFEQAGRKYGPRALPPGPQMITNAYYASHNALIEQDRAGRAVGPLSAGHKKDVVNSARLRALPQRVAIYGWHQPNGKPIQPLSTVHESTYADYSHGIRLVHRTMTVGAAAADLDAVLRDEQLSALVSDEGPLDGARLPG